MCGEEGRRLPRVDVGSYFCVGLTVDCRPRFVAAEALGHELHVRAHVAIIACPRERDRYVYRTRDLGGGDQDVAQITAAVTTELTVQGVA